MVVYSRWVFLISHLYSIVLHASHHLFASVGYPGFFNDTDSRQGVIRERFKSDDGCVMVLTALRHIPRMYVEGSWLWKNKSYTVYYYEGYTVLQLQCGAQEEVA